MKNKNKFSLIVITSLLCVILILVLSSIVFAPKLQNNALFFIFSCVFVVAVIIVLFFIYLNDYKYVKTLENRLGLWNTISYRVKGAGETAFNNLPIGIVVLDDNENVCWANEEAKTILHSNLNNINLSLISNGKLSSFIKNSTNVIDSTIELYEKIYEINYDSKIKVIYLKDVTDYKKLINQYDERIMSLGYINIDNIEEATIDMDVQEKIDFNGRIMATIVEYMESFNIFVRTISDTKSILLADKKSLLKMIEDKFSILDKIKLIGRTPKALVTISMGISCIDTLVNDLSIDANEQLDLALKRGGDQVVVKLNDKVEFYGGKSDTILPSSQVDVRSKYDQLESIISGSSTIYIVGHKYQDADAFGSSIACHVLAKALNIPHYILFNEDLIDDTVKRVYADVKVFDPELSKIIINPNKVQLKVDEKSLLLIVDCQNEANLIISDKEFNLFKRIAVIDHHRKGEYGAIDKPVLYFTDTTASSTVELLFQCYQFSNLEFDITSMQATWMMLGMVVDTNNFIYRTTATTFEVASILNKYQADMARVKEYLKEDLTERINRNNLIAGVERYHDIVAIAKQSDDSILDAPTIAKVSDDLLSISGIDLAVTIAKTGTDKIRLSARSINRFNCQLLMEKLGGGGHYSGAACELKGYSMDEVTMLLKSAIDDELVSNGSSLDIILTRAIKKNNRGDLLTLSYTEGFNLINDGVAVLATPENIKVFEEEKELKLKEIEKERLKNLAIKDQIESFNVEVKLDLSKKINQSYVLNHIIISILHKLRIRLNKNQIKFDCNVQKYGTYNYQVIITEDIIANAKIFITEK